MSAFNGSARPVDSQIETGNRSAIESKMIQHLKQREELKKQEKIEKEILLKEVAETNQYKQESIKQEQQLIQLNYEHKKMQVQQEVLNQKKNKLWMGLYIICLVILIFVLQQKSDNQTTTEIEIIIEEPEPLPVPIDNHDEIEEVIEEEVIPVPTVEEPLHGFLSNIDIALYRLNRLILKVSASQFSDDILDQSHAVFGMEPLEQGASFTADAMRARLLKAFKNTFYVHYAAVEHKIKASEQIYGQLQPLPFVEADKVNVATYDPNQDALVDLTVNCLMGTDQSGECTTVTEQGLPVLPSAVSQQMNKHLDVLSSKLKLFGVDCDEQDVNDIKEAVEALKSALHIN